MIDCGGLVGTYLTENSVVAGGSQRLSSRSLISFTGSGQIFFTDSGEGGEANLTKACVNALIAAGDISKEICGPPEGTVGALITTFAVTPGESRGPALLRRERHSVS